MRKLNNKGYLIVEIILASVIAFTIMYFLIELTFNLKSKSDDIYKEVTFISDKSVMTKTVMADINNYEVTKLDFSCNTNSYRCVDITYSDTVVKRLRININNKLLEYGTWNKESNSYDNTKYFYSKKISNSLVVGNSVAISNSCFGDDVITTVDENGVNVCEKNVSYTGNGETLRNNGLFTFSFSATSQFLNNDYGITITVPYNNLAFKFNLPSCFNYDTSAPNQPVLADGMIPITFNEETNNWVKADINNTNNSWYNYDEGKWANVALVPSDNLSTYMNASVGTTIANINAYYVWIPKYSYQPLNIKNNQSNMEQICLSFDNSNEELITHPSFTFDNNTLKGIWLSKFKISNTSTTTPTAKSAGSYTKGQLLSNYYLIAQGFTNYLTETGKAKADAHLLKNTDWGAIAYFTYSKYGICNNGNGTCNSITSNSTDYSGGGNYINNTTLSTTNNIYGIYDMQTGSNITNGSKEYVMGNFSNIVGKNVYQPTSSTNTNYNHSNFKGYVYNTFDNSYVPKSSRQSTICSESLVGIDETGNCNYEGIKDYLGNYYGGIEPKTMPSAKYYNLYDIYDNNENFDFSLSYIKGDATYEIMKLNSITAESWVQKSECQNNTTCRSFYTWYIRGYYDNILSFGTTYGSSNTYSARTIITVNE